MAFSCERPIVASANQTTLDPCVINWIADVRGPGSARVMASVLEALVQPVNQFASAPSFGRETAARYVRL